LNQQQQQLLKTLSTFSQLAQQPKAMNNQNVDALNALGVLFPSDSNLSTYAVGKELSALYDSSAFVPNVNVNFSVPQAQESTDNSESEQTSQNNSGSSKKAVKQQKNPEESECSISDESRTWSFLPLPENSPLTRKGMTQQEVEKAIQVVIATRSEGKYKNTVPERMYSSLKYEIIIRICRKCCFNFPLEKAKRKTFSNSNGDNKKTMNKKSGKSATDKDEANDDQIPNNCNVLMAKIEIVDPEKTEEVILKTNGQQLLKGISTLNSLNLDSKPFNDEVMEECLSSKLKVQFTDVSYHHSKKYFAFKISIYDPALNITEPLAVTVSPAFQVFARRPSQNGRSGQDKPKSSIFSSSSSSSVVKMEDREIKTENETSSPVDEVKTETIINKEEPKQQQDDQTAISSSQTITEEVSEIKVKPEPKRESEPMDIETTLEPVATTSTEPAKESTSQVESEKKEKDLTSPSSSSSKNKQTKQTPKKKDSIKPKIEKKSAKKRKHSEAEEDTTSEEKDKEVKRAAKKKKTENKEVKVKSEPVPQITVQNLTEDNIMEELTRILSNKQERTLETLKSLIDVIASTKEDMQYSDREEFENYAREKLNLKECSRNSLMIASEEQNAVDFSLNASSFYHSQMITPEQAATRAQENEDKYNESENESIFMSFLNPVKSENNNSNEFSDLFF